MLFFSAILLSSCGLFSEDKSEPIPTKSPTISPSSYVVGVPPYIEDALVDNLDNFEEIEISLSLDSAKIWIDVSAENPIAEWVYVLAAPFSYIGEGVEGADLQAFWQGTNVQDFPAEVLYVDGSTKAVVDKIWGSASTSTVKVISSEELLGQAWERGEAFVILPFEQLAPAWKVLAVNDLSPIHKDFNPTEYILNIPFSLLGDQSTLVGLFSDIEEEKNRDVLFPLSNYYADKLTTVVMNRLHHGNIWIYLSRD